MSEGGPVALRNLPGRDRSSFIPSPSRKRRGPMSLCISSSSSSTSSLPGNEEGASGDSSISSTDPHHSAHASQDMDGLMAGAKTPMAVASPARVRAMVSEQAAQASPIRRSQTQAMLALGGSSTLNDHNHAGSEEEKKAAVFNHAPREGPEYQLPDASLRGPMAASSMAPAAVARVATAGLVWDPRDVTDEAAQAFEAALGEAMEDSRVSSEGSEVGWLVLRGTGNVQRALTAAEDDSAQATWSPEEEATFLDGMNEFDKNFSKIQKLLPERSLQDVIAHFYIWKQGETYRQWKANRPLQYVEQAIPDYHADVCDMCERPGDLLCCDTCNLAFHMKCVGLEDDDDVPLDFNCEQCQKQYVTQPERDRAKRWVEAQVKKVQAQREKELQRIADAPAGYIGRRRTKASQNGRGRKRKREDCNSTQQSPDSSTHAVATAGPCAVADGAGHSTNEEGQPVHSHHDDKDLPNFLGVRVAPMPPSTGDASSSISSSVPARPLRSHTAAK